ncbi:MAG: methyltransferase [Pseudonocardia sp.]
MTEPAAPQVLFQLSCGFLAPRALHVIAELGVADALDDTPTTADDLARAVAVHPDALDRLLRLLEMHGVFACDDQGRWRHTDTSRWLRRDHPASMRAFAWMCGLPLVWDSFAALGHTLRTGEPGAATLEPSGMWPYLQRHRDEGAIFDAGMTAKAHGDVAAALAGYDFSRHTRLCDVGGGRGHLVTAVLDAHPGVAGVLFDLPHVAADVEPAERLDVVAGDFFVDALPAADAYVLMQVIHDWDDKDAAAILSAVARAGRPGGATVLLVEWLLPDGSEPDGAKVLDVMMLAVTGGRERTRAGYRALLDDAGIELVAVHPTASPMHVVEGRVR